MRRALILWAAAAIVWVAMLNGAVAWAGSVSEPLGTGSFGALAVDDANQHVFVSSPRANTVLVYDFNGHLVTTIPDIYGAAGMVIHGSTLYVAESTAGAIEAVDLTTLTDAGAVATGLVDPHSLAFAGGELWTAVGNYQSSQLASVDMSGTVTVFPSPSYYSPEVAATSGSPNTLYVAEDGLSPGAIYELDVASGSPVPVAKNTFTDQENIEGLVISPDGTRVIPASGAPYEFEELSASTLTPDGIVYPGEPYPAAAAVSPANGGIVATGLSGDNSPDISVFPLGKPAAIFTASTGASNGNNDVVPHGLALSADGTRLFAVTSDNVYDTAFHLWIFGLKPASSTTEVTAAPNPATSGHDVTLSATVTPSDGGGTVGFEANGKPIAGCTSVALSSGADQGTATCKTASLSAGSDAITAQYSGDPAFDGSSGATDLTVDGSAATAVSVSLSPASLFANGTATTTATATIRTASGSPVVGEAVSFAAFPANAVKIGPVTDNGDGTYTATITSSTTTGTVIITATDSSASPVISGGAFLTETSDPAATVQVSLDPTSIFADGSSTSTATAVVLNGNGDPVAGQSVSFTATPAEDVRIGAVTDHGDGTYTATITGTTTTGSVRITATDSSTTPATSGSATLTESGCATVTVNVSLQRSELVANGRSRTTAVATVVDGQGDPVAGQTVRFSASPADAVELGPVTDHGDGVYTATVTSSTITGRVIITATDTSAAPSGCTVLNVGSPSQDPDGKSVLRSVPRISSPSTPGTGRHRPANLARIRQSLGRLLTPHGRAAEIRSLLRSRSYTFAYVSPARGRLTVRWYHRVHGRRQVIATATRMIDRSGRLLIRVRLTRTGRHALERTRRLRLDSAIIFTTTGHSQIRRGRRFTLR